MGGVWGVGASLAMESAPTRSRGLLSGILQEGYPAGNLLAALTYWLVFPHFGWRGMFIVGALPAVLVIFIRYGVDESPAWVASRARGQADPKGASAGIWSTLRTRWPLFLYMVALMTAFNFFSHGTQDLYPSAFLEKQRGYPAGDRIQGDDHLQHRCNRRRDVLWRVLAADRPVPGDRDQRAAVDTDDSAVGRLELDRRAGGRSLPHPVRGPGRLGRRARPP